MAPPRRPIDREVHAVLTAKKELVLIKTGGSKTGALAAARKDDKGREGPLLYATFSEGEAKQLNKNVERLTVPEVTKLARRCFEIIPAQKRAA